MKYIVNLPTGLEITLGLPYGSATYKHGEVVPESFVTKSYPQYFSPLPEPVIATKPEKIISPVDDIIAKIKANIQKESNEETTNTPKKKAGRPAKTGFSKG